MVYTYVITGATRGIGLALTENLANMGNVQVIATARTPETATELNLLSKESGNVTILALDISDKNSIERFGEELEKVAPEGIDFFVSNAGHAKGFMFPSMDVSYETWLDSFQVNSLGNFYSFKVAYDSLSKKQTKKVLFISAQLASFSKEAPPFPTSSYGTSKVALNYIMKQLDTDLKNEKFSFAVVHPGIVKTDLGLGAVRTRFSEEQIQHFPMLTADESAKALINNVFDKFGIDNSGKFFLQTGEEITF